MPNPILNDKSFEKASGGVAVIERPDAVTPPVPGAPAAGTFGVTAPPWEDTKAHTMTIGGTCSAALVMLAFLGLGAMIGWGRVTETASQLVNGREQVSVHIANAGLVTVGILVAFALAILTSFKPKLARFTAIPYSLAEGFALGVISHVLDSQYKGIALQAVLATIGVFAVMLLLYGLRILRATPKFVKGVLAAMFGIFAIYLVQMIGSLFGHDLGIFTSTSALSIGFSLVVVTVASLRLIIDFDLIERGSKEGAPRYMEWYAAFGLIVGVVWLYIEILSLLAKLQRR